MDEFAPAARRSVVIGLAGMSVSPATPEPRPLSYWLEAGHSVPASERTVLRTMAYRWSRRRTQILNLWLAMAFFAVLMLLSRSPDVSFPPELLWLAVGCAGVAAVLYTMYHRRRLPSYEGPDHEVWIRTTRGGVLGAVAFVVVTAVYVLTSQFVGSATTTRGASGSPPCTRSSSR